MKKRIVVSLYYTGLSLWFARRKTVIGRKRLAKYMGIEYKELRNFEFGKKEISMEKLTELFVAGIKYLENENNKIGGQVK